jgi:hypothetical protein
MSFEPATGKWNMRKMPSKASTAYAPGMMIYNDGTDNVPVATSTQVNTKGICLTTKASTDTTTSAIYVLCPSDWSAEFYGDVTGTLTAAMVGDQFDFAAGALTVAQAASTYDVVECTGFESASKGKFRLNPTLGVEN